MRFLEGPETVDFDGLTVSVSYYRFEYQYSTSNSSSQAARLRLRLAASLWGGDGPTVRCDAFFF